MAFAPAQDPMIGSSTLEDELAAAAAHAGMPVEPPSPGSQAAPPGLDMAQLLAQMEAMQKELNKLKGENMKFRSLLATDDQPEQPQPPGPQQFPMTPPKATVEEETPPPAPWSQSWDPWTKRPDPWDQADGGWHQGDNNWRTTTEWPQDSGNSWASWIPQNPQTSWIPWSPQEPQYWEWLQWNQQSWNSSWRDSNWGSASYGSNSDVGWSNLK